MNISNVLMNPPYEGSLHLDILQKVRRTYPKSDIVNLSPIRWLQDPIAEYKSGTAYKQYLDIWQNIYDFVPVDHETARKEFSIRITVDLGIYKLKAGGGYDVDTIRFKPNTKEFITKVKNYPCKHFNDIVEENKVDGIRTMVEIIQEQTTPWLFNPRKLTYVFFDGRMKDGRWWTEASPTRNQFSKSEGDPLSLSVKWETEEEAYNFEKYCKTVFLRFCKWCAQSDVHPPFLLYPVMDNYHEEWTDEKLCKLFNISDDYFAYMKDCVEKW